jgi:hypothetical protein
MTIQRWDVGESGFPYKDIDGEFIYHSDHLAALQRERERREKLVEALEFTNTRLKRYVNSTCWYQEDLDACQQANAALAAAKEME